jgi:hypothetical protein
MNTPQLMGAACAVLVVGGWVAWERLRPPPCPGGVFLEFHPPLSEPGPYHFRVALAGAEKPCEFDVPLPVKEAINTAPCHMALDLKTRSQAGKVSILGLTFGASPQRLTLQVKRNGELLYDTPIVPHYTPYPMRREENKRFCGEQAFVEPACVRGSSACAPFPVSCGAEAKCPAKKVCCVSPEWGKDYGPLAASECSSRQGCFDRLGHIACHADSECPSDMVCDDTSMQNEFTPALTVCRQK